MFRNRRGGYYLNRNGSVVDDTYQGDQEDLFTTEPIDMDQSKRITWNGFQYYNLDDGIKQWLETTNKDPATRQEIDYVRTHFGLDSEEDESEDESEYLDWEDVVLENQTLEFLNEATDALSYTALEWASRNGLVEKVKKLIELGVEYDWFPIGLALKYGYAEIVDLLVKEDESRLSVDQRHRLEMARSWASGAKRRRR